MLTQFIDALTKVGGQPVKVANVEQAAAYIHENAGGALFLPPQASLERAGLDQVLRGVGAEILGEMGTEHASLAAAGVTGVNFALADTGSLVLESTDEALRLATTLPEKHFALLDPKKVLADSLHAVPFLRGFHERAPRNYLAYITGPSRTADIERVLTIGVHGPRELHVLLLPGLSSDFYEV